MPVEGFVYPNEVEMGWSVLIVLYPFTTGVIAGAFVVSSLYYVFGIESFRPLARFSLVTALAFLLVAPLPLAAHLGRPERAIEIFLTPNFTSAMAAFGYIWVLYLLLVVTETWLVFRRDIVAYARAKSGIIGRMYALLTLGVYDVSEESLGRDRGIVKALAAIGIPTAFLLFHGYSGFMFGAVKANPWWSTPLMPIIFLLSAVVSGMALLVILYVVTMTIEGRSVDHRAVRQLAGWMTGFLALAVAVEILEVLTMLYEQEESWTIIRELITDKLAVSYLGIQFAFGSLLALAVMIGVGLLPLKERMVTALSTFAAFLVLIGVFAMRWNVVIGGQQVSRSLRGFINYVPEIGGREGILAAVVIMVMPLWLFVLIANFLPPWREAAPWRETDQD